MRRNANARWQGSTADGSGALTVDSGTLKDTPYSFKSRFGDGRGTNPEELIAAAHAGCYTMALSLALVNRGCHPEMIETKARLTMDQSNASWVITSIHLETHAQVRARSGRRDVRARRRGDQGQLSHLQGPERHRHARRRPARLGHSPRRGARRRGYCT